MRYIGWIIVFGSIFTLNCFHRYYDYGGEYYTELSELYDRVNKDRQISYIIEYNTPDHIDQYYRNYIRDKGFDKGVAKSSLRRYVKYAENHIWFNITARSKSMQNLLIDLRESFVLMNDRMERCKPELIGEGTHPQYKPIHADGHIYDEPSWEITFGLIFPKEMKNEDTEWLKLMVATWDDHVVYTWRKGDIP